jgi:fatty acid desaturase
MSEDSFERVVERERQEHRRRRRRKARRGFRVHAFVYLAVNAALVVAWAATWALAGSAQPWFLPVLLGWGVGLAFHRYAARRAFRTSATTGTQQPQAG